MYIRVCTCNTLCMVLVFSCLSLFESCSPTLIMYVGCMALLMTYAMILYCRVGWVYNEILYACMDSDEIIVTCHIIIVYIHVHTVK